MDMTQAAATLRHRTDWRAYRLILLIVHRRRPPAEVITQLLQDQDGAVVYISLTPDHNRSEVFLRALTSGLRRETQGEIDIDVSIEDATNDDPDNVVIDLLNAWIDLPHDLYLVLDGYGTIEEPAIHDLVSLMLDYLPPNAHILIAASVEPPLPNLPRLRVRRQMVRLTL